jgi:ankyrin repeat protein
MRRPHPGFGLLALLTLLGVANSCSRDPLFEAVGRSEAAEVGRLLRSGADPNRVVEITQSGHSGATFRLTPLAVAAQRGDVPMIERLVAAGADPHWDDGQFTAFEWAIRFGHPAAARRLWELSDGTTYATRGGVHIPLALRVGDTATLDFVLETLGPDSCEATASLIPLARSGAQRTEGELPHVRTLLESGVRPTPEALQWAAQQARSEMVRLFVDRAERDGWLRGCAGGTPEPFDPLAGALRASLLSLEIEMVALLLERGADPNARDASGATPAMVLARHVYLQEIYARPPYAESTLPSPSPYHERWFAPLLSLLLEHGADLSLRDHEGRSAADHVPADDHDQVVKRALLRAHGAPQPRPGP